MKTRLKLTIWLLGAAATLLFAAAAAHASVSVGVGVSLNFDTCYRELTPYGAWYESPEYGWV